MEWGGQKREWGVILMGMVFLSVEHFLHKNVM